MPGRTARQQATVTGMIDIAAGMAMRTQRIARRGVVELGDVELTDEEDARLGDALCTSRRRRRTSSGCDDLSDRSAAAEGDAPMRGLIGRRE